MYLYYPGLCHPWSLRRWVGKMPELFGSQWTLLIIVVVVLLLALLGLMLLPAASVWALRRDRAAAGRRS